MPTAPIADCPAVDTTAAAAQHGGNDGLSTRRLNIMRLGYAFMGVGLVIVKWPLFAQGVHTLPLMEGVVACLLAAMSLLVFLGLRYPVKMLAILLFEAAWKLIWFAAVGLPLLVSGDVDAAAGELLFSCSFVIVIIAVIPWGYTWRRFVTAPGNAWR
ncbi:hypothetical protein [Kocuria aegyptia]|uniref:Uncharacterized protein n=1 Tax=Kocuria aegyptia TaxID=330943 RepID=A0ABN2KII4_9MICC